MQVSSLSFILWCNDLFDVRIIATCKDFVLIVYNFFFCLCNFCQIVAHHHECINNGSCWVMSHRFQELGRLQRSSGHTQSHFTWSNVLQTHSLLQIQRLQWSCSWAHIDSSDTPIATTYSTGLTEVSSGRAAQKTTQCVTFVDFWKKIITHLQLTGC